MTDLLIVGGGPVGCVVAEHAARIRNWKSVIVEKRNHIAGNCFDTYDKHKQLIHKYGPHYFRTNDVKIFNYLSKFTEWIDGNYVVKTSYKDQLYPFPINLLTLEQFYGKKLTEARAIALINKESLEIPSPKNSEEFVLSRVGKELYEAFYLGYTMKQWDMHPKDLSPSVCGRIPVRFNRDQNYVDAKFQFMPKNGYTFMFEKMTTSPLITFCLNTDYNKVRNEITPKIATLYTGPIDAYFDHTFGRLPWRSLEFEWKTFRQEFVQPCVQINYPNENSYTRSVEIKHVTKQKCPFSSISYEYPKASGPPYYPIPSKQSQLTYEKYKELAAKEKTRKNLFFAGRLAEYTYINTDQAIARGMEVFSEIAQKSDHS
jgi:UDP-galactopyranose mutase